MNESQYHRFGNPSRVRITWDWYNWHQTHTSEKYEMDLKKSGTIEFWVSPEHYLVAWNKEENCVFGLLKNDG
jgi:hypothetical protein